MTKIRTAFAAVVSVEFVIMLAVISTVTGGATWLGQFLLRTMHVTSTETALTYGLGVGVVTAFVVTSTLQQIADWANRGRDTDTEKADA